MKFTTQAQALIKALMETNHLDILAIELQFNEFGGGSLQLDLLAKEDVNDLRVVTIDDIPVCISQEDEAALEQAIFSADEDGQVTVELPHHHEDGHCCHHHHEDGHCCHHHEHHHEEGECCCGDDCDCDKADQ